MGINVSGLLDPNLTRAETRAKIVSSDKVMFDDEELVG